MDKPLFAVILLFAFFAAQHSLTISDLFKAWIIRWLGEPFYRGYYRILFTLVNLWLVAWIVPYIKHLPDRNLLTFPFWVTVWMRTLQCLGVWVLFQTGKKIDLSLFIGVRQVLRKIKGKTEATQETLSRDGIYGRVRHPIYLGCILILWGEPHLLSTSNGIMLVLLSTLYFYFGSMLEEKRMIRQFGEEYRKYQEEVPRLLPFRWKRLQK